MSHVYQTTLFELSPRGNTEYMLEGIVLRTCTITTCFVSRVRGFKLTNPGSATVRTHVNSVLYELA
jgi:hypothetical protein